MSETEIYTNRPDVMVLTLDGVEYVRSDTVKRVPPDAGQNAIAHAVLALVEQQRIANLIALGGPTHPKLCEQVSSDAATALTEWHPHESRDMGGWYQLRPEVAAALGLRSTLNSDKETNG